MLPGPTIAAVPVVLGLVDMTLLEAVGVQTKRAVTLPSPANVAVKVSPAATGTIAHKAPGSTTWPDSRVTPRAPTVLASQTRELTGEPRTAPPAPVPTTSPLRWKVA